MAVYEDSFFDFPDNISGSVTYVTSVTPGSADSDWCPASPLILQIQKYSLAVIIVAGLACNTLSLSIFLTARLR